MGTPNAGRGAIEGIEERDDGSAVLRLLAKALGLPKSALSVTSGETARLKTIAVEGEGAELAAWIAEFDLPLIGESASLFGLGASICSRRQGLARKAGGGGSGRAKVGR